MEGLEGHLDLIVLVGGGLVDMAESPLDNIGAVRVGGDQVVKVFVEVFG